MVGVVQALGSSSTVRPGSSLPSRYSRLAPPPVEMWPNWSSSNPSWRTAAAESPPPMTVSAPFSVTSTRACGDGSRARGVRGHLERAHRAVPEHRLAVLELLGEEHAGLGPDVEAHPVGRDRSGGDHLVVGVGRELRGRDDVDRQDDLDAPLLGLGEVAPDLLDLVGLEQALAHLVVLGGEEGEDHAATDEQAVGGLEQVVDHAELVGDLGPAEHHRVGTLGVLGEALEHPDLGLHEAADGGRQQPRRRRRRWPACGAPPRTRPTTKTSARPASCAANSARSSSVLAVSPGLNRRFSSSTTSPSCARLDGGLGALPHRVGGEGDVLAEQLTQPGRDRAQRVLVLGRALGAAEVGAHDDARTRLGERLDGRRGRADPPVVGDRARRVVSRAR